MTDFILAILAINYQIDKISKEVEKAVKEDKSLSRNIKIYLSQRLTGKKLDDIGVYFGIGGSGVCQTSRRITDLLKKDKALVKKVKKIEDNLP